MLDFLVLRWFSKGQDLPLALSEVPPPGHRSRFNRRSRTLPQRRLSNPSAVTNEGTLRFDSEHHGEFLANIGGKGRLEKANVGQLTLVGNNTYSGETLVKGGTLRVTQNSGFGTGGPVTLDGGRLRFELLDQKTFDNPITLKTSGTLEVLSGSTMTKTNKLMPTGSYVDLARPISGSSALIKTEAGVLVLSADNSYTGGTKLQQGYLFFTTDSNLGDLKGSLTLGDATLVMTANAPALTTARQVTLTGTSDLFVTNNGLTINGDISGAGSISKRGDGPLMLFGKNSYEGGTTNKKGVILINSAASLGKGALTLVAQATLQATVTVTLNNKIVMSGSGGQFLVDDGKELTLTGELTGGVTGGGITKNGNGTLILQNSQTNYASPSDNVIYQGTVKGSAQTLKGNFKGVGDNDGTIVFDESNRREDAVYAGRIYDEAVKNKPPPGGIDNRQGRPRHAVAARQERDSRRYNYKSGGSEA